jgi:hypothetical protein
VEIEEYFEDFKKFARSLKVLGSGVGEISMSFSA